MERKIQWQRVRKTHISPLKFLNSKAVRKYTVSEATEHCSKAENTWTESMMTTSRHNKPPHPLINTKPHQSKHTLINMFPGFEYVKRYIFKTVLRNNNHMNIFKNNIS